MKILNSIRAERPLHRQCSALNTFSRCLTRAVLSAAIGRRIILDELYVMNWQNGAQERDIMTHQVRQWCYRRYRLQVYFRRQDGWSKARSSRQDRRRAGGSDEDAFNLDAVGRTDLRVAFNSPRLYDSATRNLRFF